MTTSLEADRNMPARITPNGLAISVRLTPKATDDRVVSVEPDAHGIAILKARVKAMPEKGKANAALAALIAQWLDVPKSSCEVVSGGKSRRKQVLISGDANALMSKLKDRLLNLAPGD